MLLFRWFPAGSIPPDPGLVWPASCDESAALLLHHPLLAANLLFFLFVDLQFWAIALVQRSSWLIDPYWTLLPPLLALFYIAHPLSEPDRARATLSISILVVWSLRLTWNYFRRERWRFGYREDWRYAKMRAERRRFWLEQLFVVHATQHLILAGLSPPVLGDRLPECGVRRAARLLLRPGRNRDRHRAHRRQPARPFHAGERGARRPRRAEEPGAGPGNLARLPPPDDFGEQLFWWSIAGWGVVCGEPWVVMGTAFNTLVLAAVTVMTERRMLAVPERREAFEAYRRRTSVWVPWWPR